MNEQALVAAALQKAPEKRASFLDQICGHDPNVRQRIQQLLDDHERAAQAPPPTFNPDADQAVSPEARGTPNELPKCNTLAYQPVMEGPGAAIGPYKLLQQIGEGGFGIVCMAEQTHPVRRMVAVKIVKPGMDTAQVIARFESERQALALMDHPNIARVLDAGATISGRPYFVMELVKGVPITDFCDKNHMAPEGRLKLFVDVCHAIQHAHHKGIIHRDIKPSNVMVTLHDGVPVVKVIDFGVAKATAQKLTDKTLFTAYGQMVGTPAYMSPEQAEMSGLDIDTRTDVYSLGVLLYELMTGTTPLAAKRLREVPPTEVQRLIREEDAPRPSTRISSLGDSATVVASNRATDQKKLRQLLAVDLDWIVMKALEKDRTRRYSSPENLAQDIERYLRHEAVMARPPSTLYKLRKLVRRNKAAVLTAAAVFLALVAGTVVATWQAIRATQAEAAALIALEEKEVARQAEIEQRKQVESLALAEKKAKESAEARETEARAVLEFLEDKMLSAARPEGQDGGLGHDVSLRQVLEAALPHVDEKFAGQPLLEARLRTTIGASFGYLGESKIAVEQHEKAVAIRTKHLGPDHLDTLTSVNHLATTYDALGRHPEALKLHESTLAIRKATLGIQHRDTLTSMYNLSTTYTHLGRREEALELDRQTLELRKAHLGPDDPDTLRSMNGVAVSLGGLGKHPEALKLYEETLALVKAKLGPDHVTTLQVMSNLAIGLGRLGQHAEAKKLNEEALEKQMVKLGIGNSTTLRTMHNLASNYAELNRPAEAFLLRQRAYNLRKSRLGPDHPDTLSTMHNLANSLADLARYPDPQKLFTDAKTLKNRLLGLTKLQVKEFVEVLQDVASAKTANKAALKLREENLSLRKKKLGPYHRDTLSSMNQVGLSHHALKQHAEAAKIDEETLALRQEHLGADDPDTLVSMNNLGVDYHNLKQYAKAIKLYEDTVALRKKKSGPDHQETLRSMSNLANSYAAVARHGDAAKVREEILALQQKKLGPDHSDTLRTMQDVAASYIALGRHADAQKVREELLALRKGKLGADHADTVSTMKDLVASYEKSGAFAKAAPLHLELLAYAENRYGVDHTQAALAGVGLGRCLLKQQKWTEAEKVLRTSLAVYEEKQPDALGVFQARSLLGGALMGQGKYPFAEPLLIQGYEGLKKRQAKLTADRRDRLTDALELLVQYYDKTQRTKQADSMRTQLAAMRRADQLWLDLEYQQASAGERFAEKIEEGALENSQDHVHKLDLKAGTIYVLDLESAAFDPLLYLADENGVPLAEHDDISQTNRNARIIFVPERSGSYQARASSYGMFGGGPYVLRIRELIDKK